MIDAEFVNNTFTVDACKLAAINELKKWIQRVTGKDLPDSQDFLVFLSDGILLCNILNCLKPGSIKRVNKRSNSVLTGYNSGVVNYDNDNISKFLICCEEDFGVSRLVLFETNDLDPNKTNSEDQLDFDKRLSRVLLCLFHVAKSAEDINPQFSIENNAPFHELMHSQDLRELKRKSDQSNAGTGNLDLRPIQIQQNIANYLEDYLARSAEETVSRSSMEFRRNSQDEDVWQEKLESWKERRKKVSIYSTSEDHVVPNEATDPDDYQMRQYKEKARLMKERRDRFKGQISLTSSHLDIDSPTTPPITTQPRASLPCQSLEPSSQNIDLETLKIIEKLRLKKQQERDQRLHHNTLPSGLSKNLFSSDEEDEETNNSITHTKQDSSRISIEDSLNIPPNNKKTMGENHQSNKRSKEIQLRLTSRSEKDVEQLWGLEFQKDISTNRIVVSKVKMGSCADICEIRKSDQILSVNGQFIDQSGSITHYQNTLKQLAKSNEPLKLIVNRLVGQDDEDDENFNSDLSDGFEEEEDIKEEIQTKKDSQMLLQSAQTKFEINDFDRTNDLAGVNTHKTNLPQGQTLDNIDLRAATFDNSPSVSQTIINTGTSAHDRYLSNIGDGTSIRALPIDCIAEHNATNKVHCAPQWNRFEQDCNITNIPGSNLGTIPSVQQKIAQIESSSRHKQQQILPQTAHKIDTRKSLLANRKSLLHHDDAAALPLALAASLSDETSTDFSCLPEQLVSTNVSSQQRFISALESVEIDSLHDQYIVDEATAPYQDDDEDDQQDQEEEGSCYNYQPDEDSRTYMISSRKVYESSVSLGLKTAPSNYTTNTKSPEDVAGQSYSSFPPSTMKTVTTSATGTSGSSSSNQIRNFPTNQNSRQHQILRTTNNNTAASISTNRIPRTTHNTSMNTTGIQANLIPNPPKMTNITTSFESPCNYRNSEPESSLIKNTKNQSKQSPLSQLTNHQYQLSSVTNVGAHPNKYRYPVVQNAPESNAHHLLQKNISLTPQLFPMKNQSILSASHEKVNTNSLTSNFEDDLDQSSLNQNEVLSEMLDDVTLSNMPPDSLLDPQQQQKQQQKQRHNDLETTLHNIEPVNSQHRQYSPNNTNVNHNVKAQSDYNVAVNKTNSTLVSSSLEHSEVRSVRGQDILPSMSTVPVPTEFIDATTHRPPHNLDATSATTYLPDHKQQYEDDVTTTLSLQHTEDDDDDADATNTSSASSPTTHTSCSSSTPSSPRSDSLVSKTHNNKKSTSASLTTKSVNHEVPIVAMRNQPQQSVLAKQLVKQQQQQIPTSSHNNRKNRQARTVSFSEAIATSSPHSNGCQVTPEDEGYVNVDMVNQDNKLIVTCNDSCVANNTNPLATTTRPTSQSLPGNTTLAPPSSTLVLSRTHTKSFTIDRTEPTTSKQQKSQASEDTLKLIVLCSQCKTPVGSEDLMVIEELQLHYHLRCFTCCQCNQLLGDGKSDIDVRIRRNRLHCVACYMNRKKQVSAAAAVGSGVGQNDAVDSMTNSTHTDSQQRHHHRHDNSGHRPSKNTRQPQLLPLSSSRLATVTNGSRHQQLHSQIPAVNTDTNTSQITTSLISNPTGRKGTLKSDRNAPDMSSLSGTVSSLPVTNTNNKIQTKHSPSSSSTPLSAPLSNTNNNNKKPTSSSSSTTLFPSNSYSDNNNNNNNSNANSSFTDRIINRIKSLTSYSSNNSSKDQKTILITKL